MTPKKPLLIFTDLDGTLLDHDTYDFSPAQPALAALRTAHVPLILCSSKTYAEMNYWRKLLEIDHPFVTENGCAIFMPPNYFTPSEHLEHGAKRQVPTASSAASEERNGHQLLLSSVSYSALRAALPELAKQTNLRLIGFGDLTVEEVAAHTNLTLEQAQWAKMRHGDEPFFIDGAFGKKEIENLQAEAWRKGLRVTAGGRFFHLTGECDKGTATRELIRLYQAAWQQPIRTVGLGDSLNDLPLLQAVDAPILVCKKSGAVDQAMPAHIKAQCTVKPGPEGWNQAILEFLK